MSDKVHVSIPVRLSKVRELSSMVEVFGNANGLPQQRVFVINLALDELITNTVMHGLKDVPTEIDIMLQVHADTLVLTMEDNGQPFGPTRGTGRRHVIAGGSGSRRPVATPDQDVRRPSLLRVRERPESVDHGTRSVAVVGLTRSVHDRPNASGGDIDSARATERDGGAARSNRLSEIAPATRNSGGLSTSAVSTSSTDGVMCVPSGLPPGNGTRARARASCAPCRTASTKTSPLWVFILWFGLTADRRLPWGAPPTRWR